MAYGRWVHWAHLPFAISHERRPNAPSAICRARRRTLRSSPLFRFSNPARHRRNLRGARTRRLHRRRRLEPALCRRPVADRFGCRHRIDRFISAGARRAASRRRRRPAPRRCGSRRRSADDLRRARDCDDGGPGCAARRTVAAHGSGKPVTGIAEIAARCRAVCAGGDCRGRHPRRIAAGIRAAPLRSEWLGSGTTGVVVTSMPLAPVICCKGADAAVATGLLGAFWGVVYLSRRSAVAPMVSHAGFDLLQIAAFVAASSRS